MSELRQLTIDEVSRARRTDPATSKEEARLRGEVNPKVRDPHRWESNLGGT